MANQVDVAVFDTKSFDREYLLSANDSANVNWRFYEFPLSAETAFTAKGAFAVCVFVNDRVDVHCIEQLSSLGIKLIALRCAGHNNVALEAAHSLGIPVVRVPAYSPHAVAEHAVGLLLTLNRKIHRAYNRVRELNFSLDGLVGFDIFGKTVGIVGTGHIGMITAQIFKGFGANVIAYDPKENLQWAGEHDVRYVDIDSLWASSDVISLHLPLLPETLHLVDSESIAKMKRGVFLINTSRGKLIDSTSLIAALKSGQIGGVALDVYEEEEGVFFRDLSGQVLLDDELSHLLVFPNVLITSHQAFLTREALCEISRVTTQNILAHHGGRSFLAGTTL